jgi:Straboviridae/Ackermannviridae/Kyanoviridae exonuclease subunit 1
MKLALLADTHWGVRGDNPVFLEFFSKFFREFFFPYIDLHHIDTVVHLGDLVDRRKYLSYTTANVMRREYIEPSSNRNLRTYIIAGNHDCSFKNTNEINALREVVMGRNGFNIYSNPGVLSFGNVRALMLPWICAENEERSLEAIYNFSKIDGVSICFAHLELVGFEMAKGQMMDHGMATDPFEKFKAVYTGHYHHKSSKGNIHYLGSPYEMTWADCDDLKGFHVLDTETLELTFIPNPFTLYKKLHVSPETKKIETTGKFIKLILHEGVDRKKLDKMVEKIDAVDIQVLDEHLDHIGTSDLQIDLLDDTLKIMKDYVLASDLEVDKAAMVNLMTELYQEAQ